MNLIPVISRETEIDDDTFPVDMAARVLESVVVVWDLSDVAMKGRNEVSTIKSDSFSTVFKSNVVMNDEGLWT